MRKSNKPWFPDYVRCTGMREFRRAVFWKEFLFWHRFRFMVYFRTCQKTRSKLLRFLCRVLLYRMSRKYGIEIQPSTKIGKGFVMIHPYNITISTEAVIGDNVNIFKGATVGISQGKHPGAPVIGNCVQIGLNATVVGGIHIGDDVMIAPNSFVNVDVPSHSVVLGSPCRIIPKADATREYIFSRV